ncbi:MAG: hypothetical protein ACEY3M_07605 [Wolbachia sp.]
MIKNEYQRRIAENKNDESSDKKFARENQIKQGIKKLMEDYYSQENEGDKGYISEEEYNRQ